MSYPLTNHLALFIVKHKHRRRVVKSSCLDGSGRDKGSHGSEQGYDNKLHGDWGCYVWLEKSAIRGKNVGDVERA